MTIQLEAGTTVTVDGAIVAPRNVWWMAYWSADIERGKLYARTLLGEPIVFYRLSDGTVAALEDTCPHRFVPLSLGRVTGGDLLECAYHGLQFNSAGICMHNPHGDHKIPPGAKARSYTVTEKHSLVWIWLGDGEPDPATIPDYQVLDDARPQDVSTRDHLMIAADYRLITDNLLDLSHVSFLHAGALTGTVDDTVHVTQDGTTVSQARWSYDVPVPSVFDMLFKADGNNVDSWTEMHWRPAGCMILDTGVREPGAPKETGSGYYGLHMLTPETATTTHYHFAAVRFNAPPRSVAEDLELRERLSAARRFAFAEQDAPVLEAQQRRMSRTAARRPALLAVDAGPVRVQRMLTNLIDAEG